MTKKFKVGDMVRVVKMEEQLKEDHDYEIGDICEVKDFHGGDYDYAIWTEDKTDFWFFKENELEGVQSENCRV